MRLRVLVTASCWLAAFAAQAQNAIQPQGDGVLRICRNWDMLGKSCRNYHHVKLPASIRLGDTFRVEYGSNRKSFDFQVGRIKVEDGICAIHRTDQDQPGDRVKVACASDP
jgi:hypothetical protein